MVFDFVVPIHSITESLPANFDDFGREFFLGEFTELKFLGDDIPLA
jgi:hypothetical protein